MAESSTLKPATYDPDLVAAIRAARADLYAAQAARRRTYLATNRWPAPLPRGLSDVQEARANLDAARSLAVQTRVDSPAPKELPCPPTTGAAPTASEPGAR